MSAGPASPPAPSVRGKAWFWAPVLPLVALDLWSKWAVFAFLDDAYPGAEIERRRHEFDLLPDPFGFAFVQWINTGTIWGLGRELTVPLMVLRTAALFLLAYFAWRTPAGRKLQLLVLGLITAGAIGNLYDNFTQPHRGVRDFLYFFTRNDAGAVTWDFPAFNVADSCICVGAITLAVLLWRQDPGTSPKQP